MLFVSQSFIICDQSVQLLPRWLRIGPSPRHDRWGRGRPCCEPGRKPRVGRPWKVALRQCVDSHLVLPSDITKGRKLLLLHYIIETRKQCTASPDGLLRITELIVGCMMVNHASIRICKSRSKVRRPLTFIPFIYLKKNLFNNFWIDYETHLDYCMKSLEGLPGKSVGDKVRERCRVLLLGNDDDTHEKKGMAHMCNFVRLFLYLTSRFLTMILSFLD